MPIDYAGLRSRAFSQPSRPLRHQIAGQQAGDDVLDAMEAKRLTGEREGYQQNLDAMGALEKMYGSPSMVRSEGNDFATSSGTQTRAGRAFALDAPRRQSQMNEKLDYDIDKYMGTEFPMNVEKAGIAAGAERYKADQAAGASRYGADQSSRARLGAEVMKLDPMKSKGGFMGFGGSETEDPEIGPAQRALLQGLSGGGSGAAAGVGGISPDEVRTAAERAVGRPLDDAELNEIMNDPESLRELGLR